MYITEKLPAAKSFPTNAKDVLKTNKIEGADVLSQVYVHLDMYVHVVVHMDKTILAHSFKIKALFSTTDETSMLWFQGKHQEKNYVIGIILNYHE